MAWKASIVNFATGVMVALALTGSTSSFVYAQERLPKLGCVAEDNLISADASISTEITFVNRSARAIRAYWVNYKGKRVYFADIQPGGSMTQQTFVTHPWVITGDASGDCIAIFLPAQTPGVGTIE